MSRPDALLSPPPPASPLSLRTVWLAAPVLETLARRQPLLLRALRMLVRFHLSVFLVGFRIEISEALFSVSVLSCVRFGCVALDSFLFGHENTFYGKLSGVCCIKPDRLIIATLRYSRKGSPSALHGKERRRQRSVIIGRKVSCGGGGAKCFLLSMEETLASSWSRDQGKREETTGIAIYFLLWPGGGP